MEMVLNKATTMAIKSSKVNAIIVARPDTELLIAAALRRLSKYKQEDHQSSQCDRT